MTTPAPFPPVDGTQPCVDVDPELFFPQNEKPEFAAPAIAVCRSCPFIHACLAYALTHDVDGVWGGTNQRQRHQLRRVHGIRAVRQASPYEVADSDRIAQMRRAGKTIHEIEDRRPRRPRHPRRVLAGLRRGVPGRTRQPESRDRPRRWLILAFYEPGSVDVDRLIVGMQCIAARQVSARAAALRETQAGQLPRLAAHVIVDQYNKQPGRRLTPFAKAFAAHRKDSTFIRPATDQPGKAKP